MTKARPEREIAQADHRALWHPFTPMAEWLGADPLIVESGEGATLRDVEGREYIDGNASLWCCALGHRRPEIDRAVREQLDRVAHSTLLGLAGGPSAELAERLVEMTPAGLEKVFFSDNGACAAEIAVKMAFQYWRQNGHPERDLFVCVDNGYHGDTLGAVSVGGIDLFHEVYRPLLFETRRIPSPYCYRCPLGKDRESCGLACAQRAQEVIASSASRLAAVIIEPRVQGAGGIIVAPDGYLRGVADACREAGALLIADEVATGFYRTGKPFACDWEDVKPDLMTVGKALTGGYLPVAATLTTRRVFDGFLGPGRTFYHGHTFTGNALGCAAANAALDVMRAEGFTEALEPRLNRFAERLDAMRGIEHVGDVRRLGLFAGIELVRDKTSREPFPPEGRVGAAVCAAMRPKGVILRPLGDVLVVVPPLTIEMDQLDRLLDAIDETTREVAPTFATL